ncbi:SAM-dependent methyltransferase [Rhizobium sp. BK529]|uniref:class I SAM-dependent methyltransferase n=1 Tax=unclassified Rhizobium TaxID=2613769 RepID=UPI00104B9555|nr:MULTISPECIES: class I SAM-dependent methyltransferase [unclassified Rhizobium]MBB3592050.1 SAM-dependent methyltransferase [Rhizobium sp. BK529]TCS06473.1 ubiquinone/menaquinone biosynthesis C-methylase UbiE [Rhizobium sp. BK418]
MSTVSDDPLYRDPSLAQFYDAANRWGPDFDFCVKLAEGAQSALDLGCGTGELTAALAATRIVTGVDPAAAMLDIGRSRPGGDRVEWVEGDARIVRLGRKYDLVVLTGHAFQVFLTEEDQRSALATIAAHLSPAGRFVFDTRNPGFRGERDVRHSSVRQLEHAQLGTVEASDESHYDEATGILSYENVYRVRATGERFAGRSKILYTPRDKLSGMMRDAGLTVDVWYGDWEGSPFHVRSREIIPVGRLA